MNKAAKRMLSGPLRELRAAVEAAGGTIPPGPLAETAGEAAAVAVVSLVAGELPAGRAWPVPLVSLIRAAKRYGLLGLLVAGAGTNERAAAKSLFRRVAGRESLTDSRGREVKMRCIDHGAGEIFQVRVI